jgi:predicted RNase H-like HicB family nuclease
MAKELAYYMDIDYPVEVKRIKEEEGGGFFVSIPLLPGCMSDGESLDEAYANIQEAKEEWLSSMLERGMKIPEPAEQEEYSGKFIIRLPKTLHRALAQVSKREGVSLNQYVTNALAFTLGQKS